MPLAVGTLAPDFTLKTLSDDGLESIHLLDHRGEDVVVLLFFPAVFTSVCTQEMCDVSNGVHALQDAVVYGISVDLPWAQRGWAVENKIETLLLSDSQLEVTKAYDVVWSDFAGLGPVSARASFVINRNGVITYASQTPSLGDMPDFGEIQRAVEAAL